MSIHVIKEIVTEEPKVYVTEFDAKLIKRIRDSVGNVEAVCVTRWLTKASLRTCKNFVEEL